MDSIIFQANVIGMLMYIIPAMLLFFYIINGLEERLVERKLYLACGVGVVLGSVAEVIMFLSGTDLYTDVAYASMILVTPFIVMIFIVSSSLLLKNVQVLGGILNTNNTLPILDLCFLASSIREAAVAFITEVTPPD